MRWNGQELGVEQQGTLPGLARLNNLVRSVQTPDFAGVTFHEVLARSALNRVPGQSYVPFGWTINPYRGCQHACVYCLDPGTSITMADGSTRPLRDVEVGDVVVGTVRRGGFRRYAPSTVLAKWSTSKRAYRVTLADGTTLVASGDHRFLTERGWKHVTGAMVGAKRRPHLTTGDSLIGFGLGTAMPGRERSEVSRRGYLTGMVRGDGMSLARDHPRRPVEAGEAWCAGFLPGIFDAEGSDSQGILRLSNSDARMIETTARTLRTFAFDAVRAGPGANGVLNVRLRGGLAARQRFLDLTDPAILRKRTLTGGMVRTNADLRVVAIEDLGTEIEMLDITTSTEDFIANGVVSHNCFARPTHEYLDLDAGRDFDRELIVKVNVGEVLQRELARPSWRHEPVALGTNTDPYQRAEGRYALMPGIIEALAASGTPFSVLTKGTLLRRDLPLLGAAREHVPVDLAMSIAVYDDELQRSIEPGTPSTAARLATVTAAREAGFDCSVFLMPILPYLTDTRAHLDEAVRRAKAAGATSLVYSALHLRGSVKPWFLEWLDREHPELVGRYRAMYPGASAYAPKEYRAWLAERIRPILRAHRLERGREDAVTGGVASSASASQPTMRRASARPGPGRPSSGGGHDVGDLDLTGAAPTMLF